MHTLPASPPSAAPADQSGCLNAFLFTIAAAWIIGVVALTQFVAWGYDQVMLLEGQPLAGWAWLLIALGQALLLALPVVPLALLVRAPRYRIAYRAWALAIGLGALLGLARLLPSSWTQPAALAQIALALLATFAISKLRLWDTTARPESNLQSPITNNQPPIFNPQSPISSLLSLVSRLLSPISYLALALALLITLPWLRYGALGSWIDTLLGLLAGLSLGLLAGLLLDRFLAAPLSQQSSGPARDIGFGGFAAGIALLILGAGYGFGGSQILLLLALPPLGFAALALARPAAGRSWLPLAALLGVAAAAPLVFVDPDEFTLLLGLDGEVIAQGFKAAGQSLLLAWLVGAVLWARSRRIAGPPRPRVALGGLAAASALSVVVYFAAGQPGFYGERLFVILRDQADVGQASSIADRDERIRFVYTTLTRHADQSQTSLRATLDGLGVAYTPYYLVNAIEVDGGPLLRAYLASQPEVDRILDSPHLRPLPAPLPVGSGDAPAPDAPPWNIRAIRADQVWDELGVTGEGIVVGESDSGVQGDHPALRDGYRGRDGQDDYNWLDPWNGSRAPVDIGGHGTHTTGSVLGRGGIGVAPGAEWIGCVNLARNLANPPLYLDCMQFMLAPYAQGADPLKDGDPARAPHVLNNSWGCPPLEGCDPGSLAPAVRALRAAGIFVVVSAGNEGPNCGSVSSPIAIYDEVFSVGAFDEAGDIAPFSSRGPVTIDGSNRAKPDILAPGVDVLSSLPGSTYGSNEGTSMAGPHVAGVVALIWSANPALIGDIERTEQILIETAQPYSGERAGCFTGDMPSNAYGYGLVDAYAAVQAALAEVR